MNLLNKLTIKNLKLNKKRTIVTIIGITLSVALLTAVSSIYQSAINSMIDFEVEERGNYHVAFSGYSSKDLETFENNRAISELYYTENIGYAKLENSKNKYKPYIFIKGMDDTSFENLQITLKEGRLPKNKEEIVIPEHLQTNGGVKYNIGDVITLDVGTRVHDNEPADQNSSYAEPEYEQIINTTSHTYKIVGIIERPINTIEPYNAPGYTFVTYLDNTTNKENIDIYVRYTKQAEKDYIPTTANILGIDKDILNRYLKGTYNSQDDMYKVNEALSKVNNFDINGYLIILETNPLGEDVLSGLGTVVIIVCLIIVFTSVFCIKNSFDISITEKTKQYGMLKSIGATKKQVKKNVFFEATILGLIGIPLGIIFGLLATYILIIVSNFFLKDAVNIHLRFALSLYSIIFAIILGIITIYLSALRSAKRSSKIEPINSIRNSANIKLNPKKIKSPKLISKLFGIGGDISYKNLKRNKKKYRTTIISLTVSTFTFIALFYFMSLAFLSIKDELKLMDYNILLTLYPSAQDNDNVSKLTNLDNIKDYIIINSYNSNATNATYTKDYIEKEIILDDDDLPYLDINAINDEQFKKYVKSLNLDYEEVKNQGILINDIVVDKYDGDKGRMVSYFLKEFTYQEKDIINLKDYDDYEYSIPIVKITKTTPLAIVSPPVSAALIISDSFYDQLFPNGRKLLSIYYQTNDSTKLQKEIENIIKEENISSQYFSLNNVDENARVMRNLFTLIAIFLYGFIIVITLIGITNIFNTITTSMELRRQEFAMLKSIGMTKKEFNRMIRLETVFMGTKSLTFGIVIGTILSYLIYLALGKENGLYYNLPLLPIVISIIAVFLLIIMIMKYSLNKINKQNTIETIRNENI